MDRPVKSHPPTTHSLQDAKAHFSEVVAAAMGGRPQHVTRRGKPAVVIVASADFDRLAKADRTKALGFIDYLRAMPLPPAGEPDPFDPMQRAKLKPRDIDLTP